MKRLEVFLLPLDGMLVHRRSLPRNLLGFPQQFTGTHLYTWVEIGTVRVKCLAQEHNTMFPARARSRTARSGVERTNHEATAPPTVSNEGLAKFVRNNEVSLFVGSFPYILPLLGRRIFFAEHFVIQVFVKSRFHCCVWRPFADKISNLHISMLCCIYECYAQ